MTSFDTWPLRARLAIVAGIALLLNMALIAMPGHYNGDELGWIERIETGDESWGLGFANLSQSGFFRPLAAALISAALRLPTQPFGSHAALAALQACNSCLLYALLLLFRRQNAFMAAVLFAIMPATAYTTGWIAGFFDQSCAFFGLVCLMAAVRFWRGGATYHGYLCLLALAASILCKETAIVIPLAGAIIFLIERDRADRGCGIFLAAGVVLLGVIYLSVRAVSLLHLGHAGGGYGFGNLGTIALNGLAYFGFPFAFDMAEITAFTGRAWWAITPPVMLHGAVIAALVARRGWQSGFFYVLAYTIPLLPVLVISKYETQYLYASSMALATALVLIWKPSPVWMAAAAVPAAILVAHGFVVQEGMYASGVCQSRLLQETAAALPVTDASEPPTIYGGDDTPWWVAARALGTARFDWRGRRIAVPFTHQSAGARLTLLPDCSVRPTPR